MENLHCVVTTTYNFHPELAKRGELAAAQLGLPFTARRNRSIAEIKAAAGAEYVLLASSDGWKLHTPGGEMYFHMNMAHLRMKNLRAGQNDHMASAMALQPGMTVLDCTLGLASDAMVASYLTGKSGRVVGLEASPLIALVVRDGLQQFQPERTEVGEALRRIEVAQADYHAFLAQQPDHSFDIVYFDPMFRHPIMESTALSPLRAVADPSSVSIAAVAEAKRVAAKRVVFKENSRSGEFARLGFAEVVGGKYSSVHYGVMRIDE